MRIKFEGAEADDNRLEAYEGIKSIEGLIRVSRIATHYAATGEVRFRAPYTNILEAHVSQIRNGSFEMLFYYASQIADRVASSQAKSKAEALFQFLIRRGTGQTDDEELSVDGEDIPSGDIGAMTEASEAALKASHRWIDAADKRISVIDGDDAVRLDSRTREYVEEEIMGEEVIRDVSVAALNVNSKNGRAYLLDEHRTVPFIVHRDAEPRTVSILSRYLTLYADRTGATVNIRYRPVRHVDGKVKRLIVFDAREAA